ncbi:hypothetical protein K438DRAFT_1569312, partial [Mycena galopus ATCC 62051]
MDASRCSQCGNFSTGASTLEALDLSVPGTRHHTLANTNQPPEDSDKPFILSLVSDVNARIASLDVQISKLIEKMKPLQDERASLLSYRTRNKAILSPLRRMPPEVLSQIFAWTLPSIGDVLRVGKIDTTQSPWLLTQISSRWRAISLGIPSLWSRVAI